MKKNSYLMILVFVVIAAIYNIVLFSTREEYTSVFWSAYGFTMLALIVATITYPVAFKGEKYSAFLNVPVTLAVTTYFFSQLLLGIILMLISDLSIVFANVLQIVALALFLIIAISGLIGKNVIVEEEQEIRKKKLYIKSLTTEIEGLIEMVSDAEHKKMLTDVYEIIRYSDPMSHQSLDNIEQKIAAKVSALVEMVGIGNINGMDEKCTEVQQLIADRNRKCKSLK